MALDENVRYKSSGKCLLICLTSTCGFGRRLSIVFVPRPSFVLRVTVEFSYVAKIDIRCKRNIMRYCFQFITCKHEIWVVRIELPVKVWNLSYLRTALSHFYKYMQNASPAVNQSAVTNFVIFTAFIFWARSKFPRLFSRTLDLLADFY